MKELKKNQLYQKVIDSFKASSFEENIETTQGFILAILCRGYKSSDNNTINLFIDILNCDNQLSGKGIATFTTLLVELERQLKSHQVELFIPSKHENKIKATRMQAVVDIAYGFMLGLFCEGKIENSLKSNLNYQKNQEQLTEYFNFINQFETIDVNDDFSEQDFNDVVNHFHYVIEQIYDLINK